MESATDKSTARKDPDDIFGEYIASELCAIENVDMKRWLMPRIQSLIFSAQCEISGPRSTLPFTSLPPQQFPQYSMQGPWETSQSSIIAPHLLVASITTKCDL